MKVEGIQKGLTFINDNAKIQFPRIEDNALNINSPSSVSPLQSLQSSVQSSGSSLLDIIAGVSQKWEDAIHRQLILGLALFAVYGFVVLLGISRLVISSRSEDRNRGEGVGVRGLHLRGVSWARSYFASNRPNPFDDPGNDEDPAIPGPTPPNYPKNERF
jgi:hypothetical protein